MSILNLDEIEQRIADVESSYKRQLTLTGRIVYDPVLTELLKKDLDWLHEQRTILQNGSPIREVNQDSGVENQ
jgi:hypothetical protein